MSSKSNLNSLNTVLGKLTINNDYDVNAQGYAGSETVITPSSITVNGNQISNATFKSIAVVGIDITIPANDTYYFDFICDDFDYTLETETVALISFTTENSYISIASYDFLANNILRIRFNNDSGSDGVVNSIYVYLYTPAL